MASMANEALISSSTTTRLLACDVGTGSVRVGIFDLAGKLFHHVNRKIDVYTPKDDYKEQSSNNIWLMTCECIREVLVVTNTNSKDIQGVAFDATCSLVCLDENDKPICISPKDTEQNDEHNIIQWCDHRSINEAEEINKTKDETLQYVGGKVSAEMEIPKILWIKRHLPEQYKKISKFFDLADFLTYKASGKDTRSVCTLTCKWNYMNHKEKDNEKWSHKLFKTLDLEDLLSENKIINMLNKPMVGEVGAAIGKINQQTSLETNLNLDTVVAVGMIDAHCGGVGCLNDVSGETIAMICGTSNCHMALSKSPAYVKGVWGPYFGVMVPGLWLSEGGQSSSGNLIDHTIFDSAFFPKLMELSKKLKKNVYQILNEEVIKMEIERLHEKKSKIEHHLQGKMPGTHFDHAVAGSITRDFHMLGYHFGNRSPRADPTLRGMISGLSLNRSLQSLALRYFAAIQSICYGTRHIIEVMNNQGHKIKNIAMCGGGINNPLLIREMANITHCNINVVTGEAVLLGGARIAAVAAKLYSNLGESMKNMTENAKMYIKKPDTTTFIYHEYKFNIFKEMYRDQMKYMLMMDGVDNIFDEKMFFNTDDDSVESTLIKAAVDEFMTKEATDALKASIPERLRKYLKESDFDMSEFMEKLKEDI